MKKLISTILALTMVLSMAVLPLSAAFISTQDKPVYVCLGDSNSAGYGLDAYEENAKKAHELYPELTNEFFLDGFYDSDPFVSYGYVCDEMYSSIIANTKDYDLRQHGHSAWRTNEALRMLQDDYDYSVGSYWDNFWLTGMGFINYELLKDEHDVYLSDVCDADYITLQFSSNDILTQAFLYYVIDVVETDMSFDLDFKLSDIRSIADVYATITKVFDAAEKLGDIAKVLTSLDSKISENEKAYEQNIVALIDRIRELNPDAKIFVIGALNPLSITGDYYTRLMTTAALYIEKANVNLSKVCKNRDNCMFVDISKAHTYGVRISDFVSALNMEEINAGDWNSTFKTVKLVHPDAEGHAYIAKQILKEINNSEIEIELTAAYARLSKRTTLKWTRANGALRYNVYRAEGNGAYKLVYTTIGTTYIDLLTKKGKTYSYKVEPVMKLLSSTGSGGSNVVTVDAK